MALQERLTTDRSLARFAGQFVPLKVTTSDNPDWRTWSNLYRTEGGGIPIVYVIRADGEMLYGESGAPHGDELPALLASTLAQAGRVFNDAEAAYLAQTVEQVKAAATAEDPNATAAALAGLAKLGTPGALGSHAELAKEADALYQAFAATAKEELAAAQAGLADPATALPHVLTILEAEANYFAFPELKTLALDGVRELQKNRELESLVAQAEALVRARKQAAASQALVRKRAPAAFELVITRYPGTEVAELARQELAAIAPDSPLLAGGPSSAADPADPAAEPVNEFRTWTDSTGRHKLEAKLTGYKEGWVRLEKRDGSVVTMPAAKLSEPDQEFLEKR